MALRRRANTLLPAAVTISSNRSGSRGTSDRPAVAVRRRVIPACGWSRPLAVVPRSRSRGKRARSEREPASWTIRDELNGGLEDPRRALMSTDVISQPSISHRGRRISLLVVLAIAVAVAVAGAVVVARSSGGTSGEHAEPSAVVSTQTSPECRVNLDYLAAEVGTMPESVRAGSHRRVVAAGASTHGQGDGQPDRDRRRGASVRVRSTARRWPTVRRSRGSSPRFRLQMPASS